MTPDALRRAVGEVLEASDFRKRGTLWYLGSADTTLVAELQKSRWGNQFYLNLAVWLNALGTNPGFRERDYHIRTRLSGLAPDASDEVFNLDAPISDELRGGRVSELIRSTALPFLRRCSTLSGVQSAHREGLLKRALVRQEARALLT